MMLGRLLRGRLLRTDRAPKRARRLLNEQGWSAYARRWDDARKRKNIPDLSAERATELEYLGDEWSLMEDNAFRYGVEANSIADFAAYLDARMFSPYLPAEKLNVLEIGPGGGRVTNLLLPRAARLYAVDVSAAMLDRLQARFGGEKRIVPVLTDGLDITGVAAASLDAVVSFDAFVHIEPWEIFRYLEIAHRLLRPGGVGVIHFADVETDVGFKLFRSQVPSVVQTGVDFAAFSVMSKGIMRKFLTELGFDVLTITNDIIPRDAVAVFRR